MLATAQEQQCSSGYTHSKPNRPGSGVSHTRHKLCTEHLKKKTLVMVFFSFLQIAGISKSLLNTLQIRTETLGETKAGSV